MSQLQHEVAGVGCVSWRTSDSSQNASPYRGAQAAAGPAHWLPAKVGLSGGASSLQLSAEVLSAVVASGASQVAGGVQQQSSGDAAEAAATATLRGRTLAGLRYQLPQGYVGLALTQDHPQQQQGVVCGHGVELDDDEREECGEQQQQGKEQQPGRAWRAVATFDSLLLWGHDAPPTKGELPRRCLDWMALAQKVHAPVSALEVKEKAAAMRQQAVAS